MNKELEKLLNGKPTDSFKDIEEKFNDKIIELLDGKMTEDEYNKTIKEFDDYIKSKGISNFALYASYKVPSKARAVNFKKNGTSNYIPDETIDKVLTDIKYGEPVISACSKYGITKTSLYNKLKARGITDTHAYIEKLRKE